MTTNRFHDDANDLVHDLVHDRLFGCASALQTALGNFSNVYVYVDSVARTKVQRCGEADAQPPRGCVDALVLDNGVKAKVVCYNAVIEEARRKVVDVAFSSAIHACAT